jgi:dolichol kinase
VAISRYTNFLPRVKIAESHRPGVIYFAIAVAISAFFFLPNNLLAFQFGALIFGLADSAAEIEGKAYGKHKIKFLGDKSWEGAAAFFLTSFVIFLCLIYSKNSINLFLGLLICLILTAAEALSSWGLDNLILPILAAYLIQLFATIH